MNPTLYNPTTKTIATPTATVTPQQTQNAVSQGFNQTITPINPPSPISVDGLSTPVQNPLPTPTPTTTTVTPPSVTSPPGTTTDANGHTVIPPPTTITTTPEKTAWQKALDTLNDLGINLGTKAQVTSDLQTQYQLPQRTEQATKDYNAYNQAKVRYQQQIESMTNASGGSTAGRSEEIDAFSRHANADLANLAVQAQASQGLLSAAQQTIKDKLDAQFQPIQDQIDFYSKVLQLKQNDLSESEKFKLTEAQKKIDQNAADVKKLSLDLHNAVLDNAPDTVRQSIFTNLDKINDDFTSGKIDAQTAQSKLYKAAGNYGGNVIKKLQADKLRQDIANGNPNLSGDDRIAMLQGDVQDVLTGRNTIGNIRLQMGRTKDASQYLTNMRAEIRKIDPNFDFVASDAGSKFVSSTYYQKAISSINNVLPDIKIATDLSDQVGRLGIKGVDNLLQKGAVQINNKKVANLKQAQLLLADSIGIALGQGAVSDMKLQLGFDVTDPSVSADVFFSNMGIVRQFLENRKAGLEGQRYKSSTTNTSSGQVLLSPDGKSQVSISDLTTAQIEEAKKAGWK